MRKNILKLFIFIAILFFCVFSIGIIFGRTVNYCLSTLIPEIHNKIIIDKSQLIESQQNHLFLIPSIVQKDDTIYMDLDLSFDFVDYDPITGKNGVYAQDWINNDYITYTLGDFYHHNTPRFLECFWNFDKVDYIIINDVHYKFVEYTTGYTDFEFNVVRLEDGTNIERDNVTEFITCQGEPYSYDSLDEWESESGLRYIAILEEIK